jgi:hypothetical protein
MDKEVALSQECFGICDPRSNLIWLRYWIISQRLTSRVASTLLERRTSMAVPLFVCDPGTLIGNALLTLGYMPIRPQQIGTAVRHRLPQHVTARTTYVAILIAKLKPLCSCNGACQFRLLSTLSRRVQNCSRSADVSIL